MSTHMIVTCMQVESSPDEVRRSSRNKQQRNIVVLLISHVIIVAHVIFS